MKKETHRKRAPSAESANLIHRIKKLRRTIIDKHRNLVGLESRTEEYNKKRFQPLVAELRQNRIIHPFNQKEKNWDSNVLLKEQSKTSKEGFKTYDTIEPGEEEWREEAKSPTIEQLNSSAFYDNTLNRSHSRQGSVGEILSNYLSVFHGEKLNNNIPYGIRFYHDTSTYFMGDKPVKFDTNFIDVSDERIRLSPGLIELLFNARPDSSIYNAKDLQKYKKILKLTSAHLNKQGYVIRNSGVKNMIIQSIFPPKKRTKYGKGLTFVRNKSNCRQYLFWDDPNQLVKRLELLLASKDAGNTSHDIEIDSIITELREAGLIR